MKDFEFKVSQIFRQLLDTVPPIADANPQWNQTEDPLAGRRAQKKGRHLPINGLRRMERKTKKGGSRLGKQPFLIRRVRESVGFGDYGSRRRR